jgi:hypothetical protein
MMFRKSLTRLFIFTLLIAIIIIAVNYFIPLFSSFQQFTWLSLVYFFHHHQPSPVYIGLGDWKKSGHGFIASVNGIVMIKLSYAPRLSLSTWLVAKPGSATFIIPFFLFLCCLHGI